MTYHHCERVATLPRSVLPSAIRNFVFREKVPPFAEVPPFWPLCCVSWAASIILTIARHKLWIKFLFLIVDIFLCYKYKKWKRESSYLVSHLGNNVPENYQRHISSSKSLKFLLHSMLSRSFGGTKRSSQNMLFIRNVVVKPNADGLRL